VTKQTIVYYVNAEESFA